MGNMKNTTGNTFALIAVFVLLATLGRFLPHPPNFTPLAAIALFGGFFFAKKELGILAALLCLLCSDLLLQAAFYLGINPFPGFHQSMIFVYGAFAAIAIIGTLLKKRINLPRLAGATIGSSILFYIVTNFGVWLSTGMYPMTIEGLLSCYAMGLPFLGTGMLGDITYVSIIFGAYYFSPAMSKA